MKVKELIKALQKLEKAGRGDVIVKVFAENAGNVDFDIMTAPEVIVFDPKDD